MVTRTSTVITAKLVWDGLIGKRTQIRTSSNLKWRSSRIAQKNNLWKIYEIVFKKLTIKFICNVLVDSCVTRWMSEVCRTKVRRRLWENSATPTEPWSLFLSPDISYCFARIVCPSYFVTLRNHDMSPNGKRFFSPAKIPHTCYFNITAIRAETLYSGSRRNTRCLFPPCPKRTCKNLGHQPDTRNILCNLSNTTIKRDEEKCTYTKLC